MSRKMTEDDVIVRCKFMPDDCDGVGCTRKDRREHCGKCGFNPSVKEKRIAGIKRKWLLQSVGLIKGENDGTV